jgi:poly(A) polymerase
MTAMAETGILQLVLGTVPRLRPLLRLIALEESLGVDVDPALRLAALAVASAEDAECLKARLKLSSAEADTLERAASRSVGPSPAAGMSAARVFLYRHGERVYRQGVRIDWARSDAALDDPVWHALLSLPAHWQAPAMPFSGRDLLVRGVRAGPRMGLILRAFEDRWIEAGFPAESGVLDRLLADAIANN